MWRAKAGGTRVQLPPPPPIRPGPRAQQKRGRGSIEPSADLCILPRFGVAGASCPGPCRPPLLRQGFGGPLPFMLPTRGRIPRLQRSAGMRNALGSRLIGAGLLKSRRGAVTDGVRPLFMVAAPSLGAGIAQAHNLSFESGRPVVRVTGAGLVDSAASNGLGFGLSPKGQPSFPKLPGPAWFHCWNRSGREGLALPP